MNNDSVFGGRDINQLCACDVQVPQICLEVLVCGLQVKKSLHSEISSWPLKYRLDKLHLVTSAHLPLCCCCNNAVVLLYTCTEEHAQKKKHKAGPGWRLGLSADACFLSISNEGTGRAFLHLSNAFLKAVRLLTFFLRNLLAGCEHPCSTLARTSTPCSKY